MSKNRLKTEKNSLVNERKTKSKKKNSKPTLSKKKKSAKVKKESAFLNFFKDDRFQQFFGLFLILTAVYLFFAFISHFFFWKLDNSFAEITPAEIFSSTQLEINNWAGKLGAVLSYTFINKSFGVSAFVFVYFLFLFGYRMLVGVYVTHPVKTLSLSFFIIVLFSVSTAFLFADNNLVSGYFGFHINQWLHAVLGKFGAGIFILFCVLGFLLIRFQSFFSWIFELINIKHDKKTELTSTQEEENSEEEITEPIIKEQNEIVFEESNDVTIENESQADHQSDYVTVTEMELDTPEDQSKEVPKEQLLDLDLTIEHVNPIAKEEAPDNKEKEHFGLDTEYDPTLDLRDYILPSVDLLEQHGSSEIKVQKDELEENKNRIVQTLNNYNIKIDKIKATIGPTITLYEIVPAAGVRISKIKNLEDDIALSLAALGIRIIAPMPGKGTIGIEVPNQKPEIVSMRSIIASAKFQNTKYELPIALGKTISNETYVVDLAKMPHLLVAGATGQGKSVGVNAIISSLLYKKHPSQLKFVLVDPKKVELTLYSKIERHYLAKLPNEEEAIITDTHKVVKTLNALCIEMDLRYDLLKNAQVRNLKEYNAKFLARKLNPNEGHKFLCYIVLVVDEFADLIMTAGKEVEAPIARIAQLARAIGIHLIIATQRPSVNIITGVIKANFPARLAFKVTSKIDSRTILDTGGADQLIGRGDMLLSNGSDIIRLQCGFIDTPEVDNLTEFIGSQRGYSDAYLLPEVPEDETVDMKAVDDSDRDVLFGDAARMLVQHQQGSTSLIQRKMKLGYNRAGRIIDQLEAAHIVGPFEGSKAREVLYKDMNSLEQYLKDIGEF